MAEEKETKARARKPKTKKVKIILPVSGVYNLPYNVGQEVELNTNQAEQLVEDAYAIFVK